MNTSIEANSFSCGPVQNTEIRNFVLRNWQKDGKVISIPIQGISMAPTMVRGDAVALKLCNPLETKTGDIIGYLDAEKIIVHRLLRVKTCSGKRRYCQSGDNLKGWGWVTEDRIIGKVIRIEHHCRTKDLTRLPWPMLNPMIAYMKLLRIGMMCSFKALKRNQVTPE